MWPILIINMADNAARMAVAAGQMQALGLEYERVEAVDGRILQGEALTAVYDARANRKFAKHPLVGPEIGCYLSHIKCWKRIAAGDAGGAVILEDDFHAESSLPGVISALSEDAGWDIAKLFAFDPDAPMDDVRLLTGDHSIGLPHRVPSTTLGYAITRDAAARLAQSSLPFYRPIDEDHKFYWEHDLTVALVRPVPLIVGDQTAESGTIGDVRKANLQQDGRSALMRGLANLRYRLSYRWGLMRARRGRGGA